MVQLEQLGKLLAQFLTSAGVPFGEGAPPSEHAAWAGQLELLVIQPTPLCNLDCDYCYLPDRANKARMSHETLASAMQNVFAADLPQRSLSVIWHAGEPLTMPWKWYEEAFAIIEALRPCELRLEHHFQTNGVLLDEAWCDLIRQHAVRVGVSMDGPAWLHDRHRRTRDGRGTHASVMRGIAALRDAAIDFHIICVLTRDSLQHPDDVLDFLSSLAPSLICFNVEEIEATHSYSSLAYSDDGGVELAFRAFMQRILIRLRAMKSPARVREIDAVLAALRDPSFGQRSGNNQNQAGKILSIAWDGAYGTYSPELLGMTHPQIGPLVLGNAVDGPFPPPDSLDAYRKQNFEISRGVERCRAECEYFSFCLGGAPANKLGEQQRFDVSETLFCRLTQKIMVDVVLEELEKDLLRSSAASWV